MKKWVNWAFTMGRKLRGFPFSFWREDWEEQQTISKKHLHSLSLSATQNPKTWTVTQRERVRVLRKQENDALGCDENPSGFAAALETSRSSLRFFCSPLLFLRFLAIISVNLSLSYVCCSRFEFELLLSMGFAMEGLSADAMDIWMNFIGQNLELR